MGDSSGRNSLDKGGELLLSARSIRLRGVAVHNLKKVDLNLDHGKLICFCGVSGSGKTSLALDTLYAEGQRRYIESFSAYTRQFLQRLERPAAEQIDGIPPAIAVTRVTTTRNSRATVGTATETHDYLRLLFSKIGRIFCIDCGVEVCRHSAQSVTKKLQTLPEGAPVLVGFPCNGSDGNEAEPLEESLREQGFIRAVIDGKVVNLSESDGDNISCDFDVIVDRLVAGKASDERICDSLETAISQGSGMCCLFVLTEDSAWKPDPTVASRPAHVDGRKGWRLEFSNRLVCTKCHHEYLAPEPRLFNFNSPLGACAECEGFGNVINVDMDLVVPDASKSLRDGAIAPWDTPAYAHALEELLALADDYDLPVTTPYRDLEARHLKILTEGIPEREFGGLQGFFAWLEQNKVKVHIRAFLSRWRSSHPCPACQGSRLRPESLAVRVGQSNLAELSDERIDRLVQFCDALALTSWERSVAGKILSEVQSRLRYLQSVGLGYLSLGRTLRTLSSGESQRVALTSTLGSNLVHMLYVLDEPSVGLHPKDVDRLIHIIGELRDRSNTVVVVEHEELMIQRADEIVEVGPGAGEQGGQVVFQGSREEMLKDPASLTGDYLAGRRGLPRPPMRQPAEHGWIRLVGAKGNNLRDLTVEFPLGCLCLVTGVSGAGKTSLVRDTLYPALCRRMRKDAPKSLPYDDLYGDGQIDDVVLIDQSPIGRSPRSNPVTYIKAFDEIRAVFANTLEARTHNYAASHFSFNAKQGGRCETCKGDGSLQVDMQFLADVYMTCPQCKGRRYRPEILQVSYRGRSIADVLGMTVRQAFQFFRGQKKVQARLKRLLDVGLEYVRLGQPANTLSSGESQRLKLAAYLTASRRGRTLFILDEPTTGLHFADVLQLLDSFEALVQIGHSLIVIEHNLQLMAAADYLIDLGPGAAEEGGRIVVQGTPEHIARDPNSATAPFLSKALDRYVVKPT